MAQLLKAGKHMEPEEFHPQWHLKVWLFFVQYLRKLHMKSDLFIFFFVYIFITILCLFLASETSELLYGR